MEAGLVPQPLNISHPPLFTGGQGQGDWENPKLPSATLDFSAQAKKGADHTNKLGQRTTLSWTTFTTSCAHGTPSLQALSGKRVPGRPQLPSGAVFSCNFTGGPKGAKTSLSWPPSSVCRGSGLAGTECACAHPVFESWCWR